MRLDRTHRTIRGFRRPLVGAMAGLMVLGGVVAGHVQADPADDALAKLNELSRQAEQTTEAMHSAQLDLNNKLAVQQAAECKARRRRGSSGFRQGPTGNVPDIGRQA